MKNNKYRFISEINVTSLVDVTMVLLIIFMITAPLLRSGIEVELPKTKATDLKPQEGVIVTITRDGTLNLNGNTVQTQNFETMLMKSYAVSKQQLVLLQADKAVPYGDVIKVMDRIKRAGINNLGLIVEPEQVK